MCGINGIYAYRDGTGSPSAKEFLATRDSMIARGPDGAGEWWSGDRRLCLGHRRLAIIDTSHLGAQPMVSACGRYIVTYNGEIYNYPELRTLLEAAGRRFSTNSDTEVLLHLYALSGQDMVHELRGMFAFAIWDNTERSLFLARDPYGIKPLYYSDDGATFRFASQVRALLAGGEVSRTLDPAGAVGFGLWGSVPEPFTLFRDVRTLPAGHTLLVTKTGARHSTQYASVSGAFDQEERELTYSQELDDRVRQAALASVRAHLLSDVEVGVFLSAGIDSGTILGLMRDAGHTRTRAITLSFGDFEGTEEDEAPLAAEVAEHYGAEHSVRTVSQEEFESDWPSLLAAMDQPSIDGINTWFVAKAARELGLKVALSGTGGDELLAGYPSFEDIPRWTQRLMLPARVPGSGVLARHVLTAFGVHKRKPKLPGILEYGGSYAGAYLLRRGLHLPYEMQAFLGDREMVETGLKRLDTVSALKNQTPQPSRSPIARVAALESCNYLRNQLLRDADWAGMAHSVEIRTPLVDVELLKALAPFARHMRGGMGKRALAGAPARALPASIINRPKTGFNVPTLRWATSLTAAREPAAATKGQISRVWAKAVLDAYRQATA